MTYIWKILEVYTDSQSAITAAKYFCSVDDGKNTVETEGYWHFPETGSVPFAEVTEEMIAKWIEDSAVVDGKNIIKSRLAEQLETLSKKPVPAPWLPQVFTPEL
jgi:hypothetical protein